jgi:hypothetical protein
MPFVPSEKIADEEIDNVESTKCNTKSRSS